jgi:hypothetical protein
MLKGANCTSYALALALKPQMRGVQQASAKHGVILSHTGQKVDFT